MTGIFLKRLTTTLLFLFISTFVWSQFSFTPKRTNIKFFHSDSTGWKITDITGSETLTTFNHSNAYVQVINGSVIVYTMVEGLWNTHPNPQFMDKIHIPHKEFKVHNDPSRFDSYSSFWISSKGGHIRVFKYRESVELQNNGNIETRTNQNVANHIFINGNKKSKISSTNTIFMIAPKGNIFEIDHHLKIWRFILTNRTITPWTSKSPTQKMAFHIFNEENFKAVIPVGIKDDHYIFQVINHKNKMGIASLSSDYFEITYNVPPIFDFISPSINSKFHLVAQKEKLGILEFLPQEDENEIPEFKTTYLPVKKKIHTGSCKSKKFEVLMDGKIIPDTLFSYDHTKINHHFGIIKLENDLILYNESDPNGTFHQSGLYKVGQTKWFLPPSANKLTPYKNALLEMNESQAPHPIYSIYSMYGRKLAENVTSKDGDKFFFLISQVLNQKIDSAALASGFTPFTYKIQSNKKWGLAHICMDTFKIIQPTKYISIRSTGLPKSLVLSKPASFDWYGLDPKANKLELITNKNPLYIASNNSISLNSKDAAFSAHFNEGLFFYNYLIANKGEVYSLEHLQPAHTSAFVKPYPNYIHSINPHDAHLLYSYKFKPIKTVKFDSVSIVKNNYMLLYNTQVPSKNITSGGGEIFVKKILAVYKDQKPLKSITKYSEVYFYRDWFIAKEEVRWKLITLDVGNESVQKFTTLMEVFGTINTLK